jgi:cytochrome b pre-mRNA-processing protein 3
MLRNRGVGPPDQAMGAGGVVRRPFLGRLLAPRPAKLLGRALFESAAHQARAPGLYREGGVPDTVEGRFECYALHVDLVLHRLKGQGPQASEVGQALFDRFLDNLDEGLRDMGVGDLSVGKKMRKLGEAIYGRMKGYDAALDAVVATPDAKLDAADLASLSALIGRVLFGADEAPQAAPLAAYAATCARALAAQPLDQVLGAQLAWPVFSAAAFGRPMIKTLEGEGPR